MNNSRRSGMTTSGLRVSNLGEVLVGYGVCIWNLDPDLCVQDTANLLEYSVVMPGTTTPLPPLVSTVLFL